MNSIEEKCNPFLQKLYEESGGNPSDAKGMYYIGRKLGLDQSSTKKIAQYLKEEGSIEYVGAGTGDLGTLVSITVKGIKKVEESLQ